MQQFLQHFKHSIKSIFKHIIKSALTCTDLLELLTSMRFNHCHVSHWSLAMVLEGNFFPSWSLYCSSLFFQIRDSSNLSFSWRGSKHKEKNLCLFGWLYGLLISLGLVDEIEDMSNALLEPVENKVPQQSTRSWGCFWFFKILNTFLRNYPHTLTTYQMEYEW